MSIIPQHAPQMFGAKKKGQEVTIKYPLGSEVNISTKAVFIESGRFSVVFRPLGKVSQQPQKYVIIYTFWEDFSKSILAHSKTENVSNHYLPSIHRLCSWDYKGKFCNVYKARYYHPLPKVLPKVIETQIDELQDIHERAREKFKGNIVRGHQCDEFNAWIIGQCMNMDVYFLSALQTLRDVATDWGEHYIFDNFHERNLGYEKDEIVLLDPMFDMQKIQKDWDSRRLKARKGWVDPGDLVS